VPKSILIVDDSSSVRTVLSIALRGAGFDVVEATNGAEGLQRLDGRPIHLIISDVNMPVMDGLAFLTAVKKMPAYKFIPVLMLTTESSEQKKAVGREQGARAWVTKPFRPEQLLVAVQKLVMS
jgi:two-component system, chemotaxis family, chemotaxis protein CheY